MSALRLGWIVLCGVALLAGGGVWAEEGEEPGPPEPAAEVGPGEPGPVGPPPRRPGLFRGGPGGPRRPGLGRPGTPPVGPGAGPGAARRPRGPFGLDLPALQEELDRHRQAMRDILGGARQMHEGLREELRDLVAQGAEREEIAALIKEKCAEQAKATAQKIAAELAQHHTHMANIFQQPGIADQLAEALMDRVARMVALRARGGPRRGRPGGPRRPGGDLPPLPRKGAVQDRPEDF